MPIKSINTCKTKIAHWALQNSDLQSHISDTYLKEKINDTTPTCPLNDFLHTRQSFLRATINTEAVLAVHSRETRNFSRDSSRFLRDESRFSRYESRFSRYESCFSREGGNLHLSGTVHRVTVNVNTLNAVFLIQSMFIRVDLRTFHRFHWEIKFSVLKGIYM